MRILYYDCFAGISGDMNLGALIDLGLDPDYLRSELKKVPLEEPYKIIVRKESRRGITGTFVEVQVGETPIHAVHHHVHPDPHEHAHKPETQAQPTPHPVSHEHSHRSFRDIRELIQNSDLSTSVKERALTIFHLLAQAEGKIHGKDPEEVRFHEVGAVDSIVDILGAAIGLEAMQVDRILCGPIELGSGTVRCAHGLFPVPAPATVEILRGVPVRIGGVAHEATTPTGAAILRGSVNQFVSRIKLQILRTGYGIGHRDTEIPNVLRVCLAEEEREEKKRYSETVSVSGDEKTVTSSVEEELKQEVLYKLESTIDDMNPEDYEPAMERLFASGARDVHLCPVIMKKSRPGVVISVLCDEESLPHLRETLFLHTTTLGIREQRLRRYSLKRRTILKDTPWGRVRVKQAMHQNQVLREKPELEDLKALAQKSGLSIDALRKMVLFSPETVE